MIKEGRGKEKRGEEEPVAARVRPSSQLEI